MPSIVMTPRLEDPRFYSKDFETAVKQFKEDLSASYLAGIKYSYLKKSKKIHPAYLHLKKEFTDKEKKRYFPTLKRFLNYIYTRDEAHNPFGFWYEFKYWDPLIALEYAIYFIEKNKSRGELSQKYYPITLAAFFMILDFNKSSTSEHLVSEERGRLSNLVLPRGLEGNEFMEFWRNTFPTWPEEDVRRLTKNVVSKKPNDIELSEAQSEIYDNLRSSSKSKFRPIIIYKPKNFYRQIGIVESSTFKNYAKLLNLIYGYNRKSSLDEYYTTLWIMNYDNILNDFQAFKNEIRKELKNISVSETDIKESGYTFSPVNQEDIKRLYEEVFIRDSESRRFVHHLTDNPLIFFRKEEGFYKYYIQASFFNLRFILSSFYLKQGRQRRQTIQSLTQKTSKYLKVRLTDVANELEEEEVLASLAELSLGEKQFPISTPRPQLIRNANNWLKGKHFRQIEEVIPIIKKISENGVAIDKNFLEQTIQDLTEKFKELPETEDNNTAIDDLSEEEPGTIKDLRTILKDLKKIKGCIHGINDILKNESADVGRIYGRFTPHGAVTHRMTCHTLNIQGISKIVRNRLLSAPKGKVLVSRDVSGQDIVIAATLAKKLYEHPELFKSDVREEFGELKKRVDNSIEKMKPPNSSPVNFLAETILADLTNHELFQEYKESENLKPLVKEAVYTYLYGGGKTTFTKQRTLNEIYDLDLENTAIFFRIAEKFVKSEYGFPNTYKKIGHLKLTDNKSDNIKRLIEYYELFLDHGIENVSDEYDYRYFEDIFGQNLLALKSLLKPIDNYERRKIVFEKLIEFLPIAFPGIMESFDYYKKYYLENSLTYPTLLDWQTLVNLIFIPKERMTRSKSYPTQASGAEFLRQWIIEFDGIVNRRKCFSSDSILIVNAIHDQLYIEVPENQQKEATKALEESSKMAARKIGIDEEILRLHAD